jgi:hypothetical protein
VRAERYGAVETVGGAMLDCYLDGHHRSLLSIDYN